MRKENIKNILLDDDNKYFYKTHGAIPHFMAYENLKNTYLLEGCIYVPKHFLINNGKNSMLLIEGVKWEDKDTVKWFEYSCEIQVLVKSIRYLFTKIASANCENKVLDYKLEVADIFDVYPRGVNTYPYRKLFKDVMEMNYSTFCKQFLLPRDLYNNVLVGTPWGIQEGCKVEIPLSIIDFGETYKYTSIFELIAEFIVIWQINHSKAEVVEFVRAMEYEMKNVGIWEESVICFFYLLWSIKMMMWRNENDPQKILEINSIIKSMMSANHVVTIKSIII